jgi:HPt (histidine-containing phosphotransfer) domain-containing protein
MTGPSKARGGAGVLQEVATAAKSSSRLKTGALLVIEDVTERRVRARQDSEQRELLAAFTALMRDRNGFLTFFHETEGMLSTLLRGGLEQPSEKRLFHTLKGNAATVGLKAIADLCHRAESELAEEGTVGTVTLERLRARWEAIVQTLRAVVPAQLEEIVEISDRDIDGLSDLAGGGASALDIVEAVQRFHWEPLARPLARLA